MVQVFGLVVARYITRNVSNDGFNFQKTKDWARGNRDEIINGLLSVGRQSGCDHLGCVWRTVI